MGLGVAAAEVVAAACLAEREREKWVAVEAIGEVRSVRLVIGGW